MKYARNARKDHKNLLQDCQLAHELNETAIDLKEHTEGTSKTWFLHFIDHETRYSASTMI